MITVVSSFLEFVPSILKVPGVTVFLSVKLNQDPLEKFFGCIRQHGRVNDNPTVLQAMTATQTLRVANSPITGNCRGASKKERVDDNDDTCKLPKRKQSWKKKPKKH